MRVVWRTPFVAMLMAIFLAAHLTCVCAGPALATAMTVGNSAATRSTSDPHACCHRNGAAPTRTHHQTRVCQHCSSAQLTAPDGVKLDRPSASALPPFLPVAPLAALAPSVARHGTVRAGDGHAPPLDHLHTRVLRL